MCGGNCVSSFVSNECTLGRVCGCLCTRARVCACVRCLCMCVWMSIRGESCSIFPNSFPVPIPILSQCQSDREARPREEAKNRKEKTATALVTKVLVAPRGPRWLLPCCANVAVQYQNGTLIPLLLSLAVL